MSGSLLADAVFTYIPKHDVQSGYKRTVFQEGTASSG